MYWRVRENRIVSIEKIFNFCRLSGVDFEMEYHYQESQNKMIRKQMISKMTDEEYRDFFGFDRNGLLDDF